MENSYAVRPRREFNAMWHREELRACLSGSLNGARRTGRRSAMTPQAFYRMCCKEASGKSERSRFGELMGDLLGQHGFPYIACVALPEVGRRLLRHHLVHEGGQKRRLKVLRHFRQTIAAFRNGLRMTGYGRGWGVDSLQENLWRGSQLVKRSGESLGATIVAGSERFQSANRRSLPSGVGILGYIKNNI